MIQSMKHFILSENTLLPVSLVAMLFGLVYWVSSVAFESAQNRQEINLISERLDKKEALITENLQKQSEKLEEIHMKVVSADAKLSLLIGYHFETKGETLREKR